MAAVLLTHAKEIRDDGSIVEIVVWELPEPLPPSMHLYKYSLFYGIPGTRWIGYDKRAWQRRSPSHRRARRGLRVHNT